jgi:putative transposase
LRKDPANYPVRLLCQVLNVSRSGYYASLKRPKKVTNDSDKTLLTRIKRIYAIRRGTYGAKRIAKHLKTSRKSRIVNHKKVARLMREANLKATVRQKKATKQVKALAGGYVYENLLKRQFEALHPNQKWVTDMTELIIEDKKWYISTIMDLFNREIIAFQLSDSPNQDLIEATLREAQKKRKLKSLSGVLLHSDQGSVYRSLRYNQLSEKMGFTPSMSRKANCWDNAVIESFFSQLKVEFPCFYPIINGATFQKNSLSYIRYYNTKRIQQKLGFASPTAFYKDYKKAS